MAEADDEESEEDESLPFSGTDSSSRVGTFAGVRSLDDILAEDSSEDDSCFDDENVARVAFESSPLPSQLNLSTESTRNDELHMDMDSSCSERNNLLSLTAESQFPGSTIHYDEYRADDNSRNLPTAEHEESSSGSRGDIMTSVEMDAVALTIEDFVRPTPEAGEYHISLKMKSDSDFLSNSESLDPNTRDANSVLSSDMDGDPDGGVSDSLMSTERVEYGEKIVSEIFSPIMINTFESDCGNPDIEAIEEDSGIRSLRTRSINLVNELLSSIDEREDIDSNESVDGEDISPSEYANRKELQPSAHLRAIANTDESQESLLSQSLRIASEEEATIFKNGQEHSLSGDDIGTSYKGKHINDDSPNTPNTLFVDSIIDHLQKIDSGVEDSVVSINQQVDFAALLRVMDPNRPGFPQCIGVSNRSIGIGYSNGTTMILIKTSKTLLQKNSVSDTEKVIDPNQRWDSMVSLLLPFNLLSQIHQQGKRIGASSLGFSPNSDLVLVGYESGLLLLWEVSSKRVVSEISKSHLSPVMSVCSSYPNLGPGNMSNDVSGAPISITFATADTSGAAHVHNIVRRGILNKVHVTSRMLLDGRKGFIHSIVPLPLPNRDLHPQLDRTGSPTSRSEVVDDSECEPILIAIALSENILVVRIAPEPVSTLQRVKKPHGVSPDSVVHISWRRRHGWGQHCLLPALIVSWGSYVEIVYISGSEGKVVQRSKVCETSELPRCVGWLDDRLISIVGISEAIVYKERTIKSENSGEGYEFDLVESIKVQEAPVASQAVTISSLSSTSQRCFCHSSCVSPGNSVFWQGPQSAVWCLALRSWPQRVEAHKSEGRFARALATTMLIHWRKLEVMPGFWPPREATLIALQDLIQKFVFSLMKEIEGDRIFSVEGDADNNGNTSFTIDHNYDITRAINVSIELCIAFPENLPLLWDYICPKLLASRKYRGNFLDSLAKNIAEGLLPKANPEAVQALVEYHVSQGRIALVERCVVQLDIGLLDFNQLMILCREFNLFNVMIHLVAGGLGDYLTPAEELFNAVYLMKIRKKNNIEYNKFAIAGNSYRNDSSLYESERTKASTEKDNVSQAPDEDSRCSGTLMVYLLQCVTGRRYPPGRGLLDEEISGRVRKEVLRALLIDKLSYTVMATEVAEGLQQRQLPWLRLIIELDVEGTLRILRAALTSGDDDDVRLISASLIKLMNIEIEESFQFAQGGRLAGLKIPQLLYEIFDKKKYEYSESDTFTIMSALALYGDEIKVETMLQSLMKVDEKNDFSFKSILSHAKTLAEAYQLQGVSLIVETVSGKPNSKVVSLLQSDNPDVIFKTLQRALDWESAYNSKTTDVARGASAPKESEISLLGRCVISHVDTLISLDGRRTASLILRAFGQDASFHVLRGLASPELQFEYIRSVMNELGVTTFGEKNSPVSLDENEGSGAFADMLARSGLEVTPELSELYVRLLCKFKPASVLSFVQVQHVVFRPDICVKYCEEAGVMDAAAKLYEDMGFDSKAMKCLQKQLDPLLDDIERAVANGQKLCLPSFTKTKFQPQDSVSSSSSPIPITVENDMLCQDSQVPTLLRKIARTVEACISLAVRSGHRSATPENATDQWFRVLQNFATRIKSIRTKSEIYAFYALLMNDILTAMMSDGQVPRDTVFSRLTGEFGKSRFGGFRGVFTGILCAAEFEYVTYNTTRSILEADSFHKLNKLHAERCKALPSRQISMIQTLKDKKHRKIENRWSRDDSNSNTTMFKIEKQSIDTLDAPFAHLRCAPLPPMRITNHHTGTLKTTANDSRKDIYNGNGMRPANSKSNEMRSTFMRSPVFQGQLQGSIE